MEFVDWGGVRDDLVKDTDVAKDRLPGRLEQKPGPDRPNGGGPFEECDGVTSPGEEGGGRRPGDPEADDGNSVTARHGRTGGYGNTVRTLGPVAFSVKC
jgi:hypothetical protein